MKGLLQYHVLIPMALIIGLVPFYPQPHLLEKLKMLSSGTLARPIDIFDLFWHSWPVVLLGYLLIRDGIRRAQRD